MAFRFSLIAAAAAAALLLVFGPSATAADASSARCDALGHASMISLMCVRSGSGRVPTACCRAVRHAARQGGLKCLCLAAAAPRTLVSGHTVEDVLRWYTRCGGPRAVKFSDLAATCSDAVSRRDGEHTSIPPPKRPHHHHHRKKDHQADVADSAGDGKAVSSQQQVPIIIQQHAETFIEKLERIGILILLVAVGAAALGCLVYIILAGPGRRIERAKTLLKHIEPFIPALVEEWLASRAASRAATSGGSSSTVPASGIAMDVLTTVTRRKTPSP